MWRFLQTCQYSVGWVYIFDVANTKAAALKAVSTPGLCCMRLERLTTPGNEIHCQHVSLAAWRDLQDVSSNLPLTTGISPEPWLHLKNRWIRPASRSLKLVLDAVAGGGPAAIKACKHIGSVGASTCGVTVRVTLRTTISWAYKEQYMTARGSPRPHCYLSCES